MMEFLNPSLKTCTFKSLLHVTTNKEIKSKNAPYDEIVRKNA